MFRVYVTSHVCTYTLLLGLSVIRFMRLGQCPVCAYMTFRAYILGLIGIQGTIHISVPHLMYMVSVVVVYPPWPRLEVYLVGWVIVSSQIWVQLAKGLFPLSISGVRQVTKSSPRYLSLNISAMSNTLSTHQNCLESYP